MPRDDFPSKIVKTLRERVAHRCSNPHCRVPTIGPGKDPVAVASIGKAAHIAAAASGGPRFIASMSTADRRSIKNGIWLCSNCATKIDVDENSYPISLLQEWKLLAEKAADAEKGRRAAHSDDARSELVAALSGMPTQFTNTAIQNVHAATAEVLHRIDPRFQVETSFRRNLTTYTLRAREQVPFQLNVPALMSREWSAALQELADHGRDVRLSAAGVEVKGSPLLEQIFARGEDKDAYISIAANKKFAVLKVALLQPVTQKIEQFDDVTGHVFFGRRTLTFEGTVLGGLLTISLHTPLEHTEGGPTTNLVTMLDLWNGRDVRHLPHFNKLLRLYETVTSSSKIDLGLEIDGLSVLRGTGQIPAVTDAIRSMHGLLQYTARVQKIATHVGAAVAFTPEYTISQAEFLRLIEAVEIIEGRRVFDKSSMNANPTCQLIAQNGASNIRLLAESSAPSDVVVREDERDIVAFGRTIRMPNVEIRLERVRPKIGADLATIKDGDVVRIEWEPTEDFRCSYRYLNADEEVGVLP